CAASLAHPFPTWGYASPRSSPPLRACGRAAAWVFGAGRRRLVGSSCFPSLLWEVWPCLLLVCSSVVLVGCRLLVWALCLLFPPRLPLLCRSSRWAVLRGR